MDAIRYLLVLDVGNGEFSEMVPVLEVDRHLPLPEANII